MCVIKTKSIISRVSLGIGYLLVALFILEIIGEFSSTIDGVYYTLGIPWRYPMFIAIISFAIALFLDKGTRKYGMIGFIILGLIFLFIAVMIVIAIVVMGIAGG